MSMLGFQFTPTYESCIAKLAKGNPDAVTLLHSKLVPLAQQPLILGKKKETTTIDFKLAKRTSRSVTQVRFWKEQSVGQRISDNQYDIRTRYCHQNDGRSNKKHCRTEVH